MSYWCVARKSFKCLNCQPVWRGFPRQRKGIRRTSMSLWALIYNFIKFFPPKGVQLIDKWFCDAILASIQLNFCPITITGSAELASLLLGNIAHLMFEHETQPCLFGICIRLSPNVPTPHANQNSRGTTLGAKS
jgi:hypothetical protein